jgi:hypothetical protein
MKDGDKQSPTYEPDFELPQRDAVREDNWAKYESRGFGVLWQSVDPDDRLGHLALAITEFGRANVFTAIHTTTNPGDRCATSQAWVFT